MGDTTLRTIFSIAARGGTETEAQLRSVGKVGAEAFDKIEQHAKAVPNTLRAVDAAASSTKEKLTELAASVGPLGTVLTSLRGGVGLASVALVGAGAGLFELTKRAAENAAALKDSATKIGVNVESLQALRFAAQEAGVQHEQFDTALQRFVKNVGDAQLGTGTLSKELGKLDSSLLKSITSAGSIEQAFDLVIKKIAEAPTEFEAASLAGAAFGRGAIGLSGIIRANAEAFQEGAQKARDLGLVLDSDLVDGGKRAAVALEQISEVIQAGINRDLLAAAPIIEAWAASWARGTAQILGGLSKILADLGLINRSLPDALSEARSHLTEAQNFLAQEQQRPPNVLEALFNRPNSGIAIAQQHLKDAQAAYDDLLAKAKAADTEERAREQANEDAGKAEQRRLAAEAAELAAQKELAADQKRAAREAAAEAKRQATEQQAFIEKTAALQAAADQGALSDLAKLKAARDKALVEAQQDAAHANFHDDGSALAARQLIIQQDFENKKAALAEKFAEFSQKLEIEAADNSLDQTDRLSAAYSKLVNEREAGLAEVDQVAKKSGLDDVAFTEQVAADKLAVIQKFNNQAARLIEEAFDKEIVKQPILGAFADISGLGREALAKLFKGGRLDAEAFADNLRNITSDVFRDVGHIGEEAFTDMFTGAKLDGQKFLDEFKQSVAHALFQIATQQIILPIVAQVVGLGASGTGIGGITGANGVVGQGGTSVTGLIQQGQSLLSLGRTLKTGFDTLSGALGSSTDATLALSSATTDASAAFGDAAAGFTGITDTGAGFSGVAGAGASEFASTTTPGVIGSGGGAGFGATVGGAAATGAELFAVVAALETLAGGLGAIKNRDTFFNEDQAVKAFGKGFDPVTKAIGDLIGFSFAGQSGSALLSHTLDALNGKFDALSILDTGILAILNPMAFNLAFFLKDLPTHGTVLRKGFEEFIENKDLNAGFFSRDSGTFKRGVGQTGLGGKGVNGVDLTQTQRDLLGGGARGIQASTGVDFLTAQKQFIDNQRVSIGLTQEQEKEVTGLGAAFRALVGDKAGQDETRTFGIIADFLGSITAEGADAAETIQIVQTAVAGLGRPALVFEKLNEFFLSPGNDIAVNTYRDAIQGLSAALFNDLPQGVDAAALALDELTKAGDGKVQFEDIKKRIEAASAEATALGPSLHDAFLKGFDQSGINTDQFASQLFDSIGAGLKQTIAENVFNGFIEGAFKGNVLGPFLDTLKDTIDKVKSGDLSQADANTILAKAASDARANLESFKPLILQAVDAGKQLAAVFDDVGQNAKDAAQSILTTALTDFANKIAANPHTLVINGIVSDDAINSFHDAVLSAMRDATIQGFVQGMVQSVLDPTVLAPFIALSQKTVGQVTSGEITPEQGQGIIGAGFDDAKRKLLALDPILQTFGLRVADLATSMNVAGDSAAATAKAFNASIDRQLLGALDPNLAKQFDLEVQQRQRLHDAKAAGADLTKVERLNELERQALVDDAGKERTRIEKQNSDEIARIQKQAFDDAKQAIQSVAESVKNLTGTTASPLPPETVLANAQAEFNRLSAKAKGGDLEAIQKLPDAGNAVIQAAQVLFGSTTRFFDIFNPTLATLTEIAGLDPHAVKLSADAQAQIDAANKDAADQIATLNKNHEEAMALFQAMLDALTLDSQGNPITSGTSVSDTGTPKPPLPGIATPATPGAGAGGPHPNDVVGQLGLTFSNQQNIKGVLAGVSKTGTTHQALLQLLNLPSLSALASLAGGSLARMLGTDILEDFPGINSKAGFDKVVLALDNKIFDPNTFSPILGFATGGSFRVNGPGSGDIFPILPNVRVSRGENVTVTTHGMDEALREVRDAARENARFGSQMYDELRKLRTENVELRLQLVSLSARIAQELNKPDTFSRRA